MLLLIFSNCYGVFTWTGPTPLRTIRVEFESRYMRVNRG